MPNPETMNEENFFFLFFLGAEVALKPRVHFINFYEI